MQKKAQQNNKKPLNAVQNVSAENYTKTPQQTLIPKTRAKYECSKQLAEMIQKANLLPREFNFSFEDLLKNAIPGRHLLLEWYELFLSLPDEIKNFIILSDERLEYKKNDAREFWINNDGYAQDVLSEMCADNEISDELFNTIIKANSDEIADFLVDYGYYGERYSYAEQVKEAKKNMSDSLFSTFDDSDGDDRTSSTYDLANAVAYIHALERLQGIRDFLLAIINLAKNTQITAAAGVEPENDYQRSRKQQKVVEKAIQEIKATKLKERILATSININEKGEITFSISEWASALQGVDTTRIRICEICENIFWANRRDAFACSKKHAKIRQMRLLRANWKASQELYLEARRRKTNKNKEK